MSGRRKHSIHVRRYESRGSVRGLFFPVATKSTRRRRKHAVHALPASVGGRTARRLANRNVVRLLFDGLGHGPKLFRR